MCHTHWAQTEPKTQGGSEVQVFCVHQLESFIRKHLAVIPDTYPHTVWTWTTTNYYHALHCTNRIVWPSVRTVHTYVETVFISTPTDTAKQNWNSTPSAWKAIWGPTQRTSSTHAWSTPTADKQIFLLRLNNFRAWPYRIQWFWFGASWCIHLDSHHLYVIMISKRIGSNMQVYFTRRHHVISMSVSLWFDLRCRNTLQIKE